MLDEATQMPTSHGGRFQVGNQAAKRRQLRLVKLDTLPKIRRTLWEVVRDLRVGKLKADVGNATVNALRLLLLLYEREDQDVRLGEMQSEIARLQDVITSRLGVST
jgi:hypothetical protein